MFDEYSSFLFGDTDASPALKIALPSSLPSVGDRLKLYLKGLKNARDIDELQHRLARRGYPPKKLTQLIVLHQQVVALYLEKKQLKGKSAAANAFQEALKAVHDPYIRLVKLGQVIFKKEDPISLRLGLDKNREKSFSSWLVQAHAFFAVLVDEPVALDKYAQYGVRDDNITAIFSLLKTAEQAYDAKQEAAGEDRPSSQQPDAKLDTLDRAMAKFYTVAQETCDGIPLLLDLLGMIAGQKQGC